MPHPTDHALQIAIEMERLGQTFYESLAQGCEALPPGLRGPKLTEQELFDAAKELRVNIMPGAAAVRDAVLETELTKALDLAIDMEAKAVAYYTGQSFGVKGIDSAALARIAEEEKKHLSVLRERRMRQK